MAAAEGAEFEGEEGEPLSLEDALVVGADLSVEASFEVGRLLLDSGVSSEVIGVTKIGDRFLVAFPFAVWKRRAVGRLLPPGSLQRATAVELSLCL